MFTIPDKNAIEIILQINEKLINHWRLYFVRNWDNDESHKQKHIENLRQHVQFVSEKIMLNISLGQQQGIYRKDLSKELLGRIYAKKVTDLYNPQLFQHQDITNEMNYYLMFENFILSICNNIGFQHFRKFIKQPNLLIFNKS